MASNQSPPPDYEPSRWDPLVIGLVAGICTVFLLLSYYKILRRHCCTSQGILQFSLNRNQRHRLSEGNHDDLSLQFQSRGLDSFLMHSLPITQFKEKDKKNDDDDEEEEEEEEEEEKQGNNTDCAVCLGEFEEGDWIKHLPNCSHIFHVSCIDLWFQAHSSCPLCRSLVYRLTVNPECSVSVDSLLETLRRDDFNRERSSHYQVLRTHILQNTLPRMERDSDSSV